MKDTILTLEEVFDIIDNVEDWKAEWYMSNVEGDSMGHLLGEIGDIKVEMENHSGNAWSNHYQIRITHKDLSLGTLSGKTSKNPRIREAFERAGSKYESKMNASYNQQKISAREAVNNIKKQISNKSGKNSTTSEFECKRHERYRLNPDANYCGDCGEKIIKE